MNGVTDIHTRWAAMEAVSHNGFRVKNPRHTKVLAMDM